MKKIKLTDYQKGLLGYIYNNFIYSSKGNVYLEHNKASIVTYVRSEYDSAVKIKSIEKVLSIINDILSSGFQFYEGNIQLNDNRTMWNINVNIDTEEYWKLVEDYAIIFENKTGVKLSLAGRMNRHVVVENTVENFLNYIYLRDVQTECETNLVNYINTHYKKLE